MNVLSRSSIGTTPILWHPAWCSSSRPSRGMFQRWSSTEAMASALSQNEELKQMVLEETPWVLEAQNEEEQRRNMAILFDLGRMAGERSKVIQQLADRQSAAGGFSWFPGGYDSWYITQYLLEGLGHLSKLDMLDLKAEQRLSAISFRATEFIDRSFQEHYAKLMQRIQDGTIKLDQDHLSSIVIHYLYTRSMLDHTDESGGREEALGFFLEQARKHWLKRGLYQQGMLALALHRYGDQESAMNIMRSLSERAIRKKEMGMYWVYDRGWFWHQLPIETHVLLLEAFAEVAKDMEAVDEMKIWLAEKQADQPLEDDQGYRRRRLWFVGLWAELVVRIEGYSPDFPEGQKKSLSVAGR